MTTRNNIIANLFGRTWVALINLLFVPVYLHYLGIEVFGIVGIFASVQAILMILDGGMSATLNREMARLSALPEKAQEMRDFARTMEIPYWGIALVVCAISLLISPLLANYWVKSDNIPTETILQALLLISIGFTTQFLLSLYSSGLMGLQKQQSLNYINAFCATLRAIATVAILAFVSTTIQAFLICQIVTFALNTLLVRIAFWRSLPSSAVKANFRFDLLRGVWRYAAGLTGIGIVTLLLTQTDKIVLSRILTLEFFGYYTLAFTITSIALGMIITSINSSYFPLFSQIVARNELDNLKQIYHQGCQVMSVLLLPTAVVMAFFAPEILFLWTRNEQVVQNTHLILTLLAIGSALNGMIFLPHFMMLAHGITKLPLYINIGAVILIVPFMTYAASNYGAVGGAAAWVLLNSFFILVEVQIMHRFILRGELMRWYVEDVGKPFVTAIIVAGFWRLIFPEMPAFQTFILLCLVSLTTLAATVLITPFIRQQLKIQILPRFQKMFF